MSLPGIMGFGMLAERWTVNAIRRRLTYPRAGFADPRRLPRPQRWVSAIAATGIVSLIATAVFRGATDRALVPLLGLAVGVSLWKSGAQSGMARFQAVGVLAALAGVAIALEELDFHAGLMTFFAIAAGALLLSGSITLWRFLHA